MRSLCPAGITQKMSKQSRRTVLITRPRPQAEQFAKAIEEARPGLFSCIIAPLLTIEILKKPVDLVGVDALIFTSANGVRAFLENSTRRDIPALCAGKAAYIVARKAQINATLQGPTAGELRDTLLAGSQDGRSFLHITGNHQAIDLTGSLGNAGISAEKLVLYDQLRQPLPPDVAALLAAGGIHAVPLFSPRTAKIFAELCSSMNLPPDLALVCISSAAAQQVEKLGLALTIADNPTQSAMIDAL